MSIKSHIVDSLTGRKARVTHDGALVTAPQRAPALPAGTVNPYQYLAGKLGATGLSSGTVNQNVDGSTTPQEFYVEAAADYDLHIMQITIIIGDGSVTHNKFGAISALTNGWDLLLTEAGVDTGLIVKAKTGGELILQSGLGRPFGAGADSFELTAYSGALDAQVVTIPIGQFIPNGLRIGRGSTDRLRAIVNDDLTGLDDLSVYLYGFKNIPAEGE